MEIILEALRRNTEIQHLHFLKCYMVDETFQKLYADGIVHLRHVITLGITNIHNI